MGPLAGKQTVPNATSKMARGKRLRLTGRLSQAAATGHEEAQATTPGQEKKCADTGDNEEALAQAPSSATGHVFPSGASLCES